MDPRAESIRNKVFIGGLDYQMTDNDLKHYFSKYGEVKEYQIIRDPVSKSSRGFGFVRFFDESIAKDLICNV